MRIYLNDGWMFTPDYQEEMSHLPMTAQQGSPVRLPHAVAQTPATCFDAKTYQTVSCYQRMLPNEPTWEGKSLRLTL